MNLLKEISQYTTIGLIATIIIPTIILWIFLYTVIKAAVKNAIIEANDILKNTKTPKEDFEEEMKGWS